MTGLSILNVGHGDTKLTFDKDKPEERERACRIVTDMLRRGFAILVQTRTNEEGRPVYVSVSDFDPETAEYVIADMPMENAETTRPPAVPRKRGRSRRRVPADNTPAVAVPRRAGG